MFLPFPATRLRPAFRRALVLLFLAALAGTPVAAHAQDPQVRTLIDRVERLQREVTDLQRTVYRGEAPPPGSVAPADGNAAQMLLRVQQLEDQLRQITGQLEELTYRQTQLEQKVDKINADTDLRLQQLEGGAAPVAYARGSPVRIEGLWRVLRRGPWRCRWTRRGRDGPCRYRLARRAYEPARVTGPGGAAGGGDRALGADV